ARIGTGGALRLQRRLPGLRRPGAGCAGGRWWRDATFAGVEGVVAAFRRALRAGAGRHTRRRGARPVAMSISLDKLKALRKQAGHADTPAAATPAVVGVGPACRPRSVAKPIQPKSE